ncbi:unnamed protein product [Rhizoctonia solani]|uniref:RlpA-like protein double-psi beta-barrel domain-containing protein n=1 Tax=Rhizoctonia solani TaxID=456999 RepID=A0A8H3CRT7_9AGAM|nr:unnamed protein product [Rhizoctonia solani]
MRCTQVLAFLAVLAASVSSMSIGHGSNQLAHRRHAAGVQESVIQARGARRVVPMEDSPDVAKRDNTVPRRRKRGLNQRRCAPKTTTGLTEAPSATSTSSVAPTTTSTPEPEPTTTQAAPTTSSKAKYTKTSETSEKPTKTSTSAKPTATSDDDSGSSSGDSYTGQATYYGTGLGACGITSKDTDYIAAVSQLLFDGFQGYTGSDPNSNPICGKKIKANYQGKSVTVTVVDRCVACALRDLDFSPTAFDQLADQSLGRLSGVTWSFV